MGIYDFSKATDTEKYFASIIKVLNNSKIAGVYSVCPVWFNRGYFIYQQDQPIYVIFDNGECLVIEYYDINKLQVEYRKMTEAELQSYNTSDTQDLFNRTSNIHDGRSGKIKCTQKSVLPYESLERVELKRITEEYSAWIGNGIVDGIKPTEETFNEIKFVMKNGKSFTICAADPLHDGYSLLWSKDAAAEEYPV